MIMNLVDVDFGILRIAVEVDVKRVCQERHLASAKSPLTVHARTSSTTLQTSRCMLLVPYSTMCYLLTCQIKIKLIDSPTVLAARLLGI